MFPKYTYEYFYVKIKLLCIVGCSVEERNGISLIFFEFLKNSWIFSFEINLFKFFKTGCFYFKKKMQNACPYMAVRSTHDTGVPTYETVSRSDEIDGSVCSLLLTADGTKSKSWWSYDWFLYSFQVCRLFRFWRCGFFVFWLVKWERQKT